MKINSDFIKWCGTLKVGVLNWILNWIIQFNECVGVCFIKCYFPTKIKICSKKAKKYLHIELYVTT